LVSYSEVALNIGIVIGFSSALIFSPFSDNIEWRSMLAVGMILPVAILFLIGFKIMPESPRWLVSKNRQNDASVVLRKIYPPGCSIDKIVEEISLSLELESIVERNGFGWSSLFCPTPAIKRMLVVGVGTAIVQQAVGIDAIQYYLVDVIEQLGISSSSYQCSLILILLGSFKLCMIFVGGSLFDRCGRRPLFFVSLLGMFVSLASISVAFRINGSSLSCASRILVICGLAMYLSFFSIGVGPGSWLIPSEVFSLSIRGKAMSIATLCNRITATLMSATFLSTVSKFGWSAFFFILAIVCVVVIVFLFIYLPETKARSLDCMTQYFADITGDTSILDAEA
jgi:MFS family permease